MKKRTIISGIIILIFIIFCFIQYGKYEEKYLEELDGKISEVNVDELKKMEMYGGIIGTNEQWYNFISSNSKEIEDIYTYFDEGNIPTLDTKVNNNSNSYSYYKEDNVYKFHDEEYNIGIIENPNDVVYEFLDYYKYSEGITYKNGVLIIEFSIQDMGYSLKYVGETKEEISNKDNWEIERFGYGV